MNARNSPLQLCLLFAALLLVTRATQSAFAFALPDATLALMFLGGLWIRRWGGFAALMSAVVAADWIAAGTLAVPSTCFTPAYAGLVPTYLAVWGGGRWLHGRGQAPSIAAAIATAFAATSLAFVVSNGFWYAFSAEFGGWTPMRFAAAVLAYYPEYTAIALAYVALGLAVHRVARSVAKTTSSAGAARGDSAA